MGQLLEGKHRLGQLHWYHWCVFFLSLILTFSVWHYAKTQSEQELYASFDAEANKTIELITERMQKYEDVLWSGAGLFYASNHVSLDEWRDFAGAISIEKKYPGINGIGFINYVEKANKEHFLNTERQQRPQFTIYPEHNQPHYMPITYIEPLKGNEKAVGLDMAHESNRYQAALKAMASGKPQITGPITLVQDAGKTPGFLFFVPVYKEKVSQLQQGKQFKGLVYAPFVVKKLMAGTLSRADRHVAIKLEDNDTILYDETSQHEQSSIKDDKQVITVQSDPNPLFTKKGIIEMYGRQWDYTLASDMGYRDISQSALPWSILICGLMIDFMLLYLFFAMARTNRKATLYARQATESLVEKTEKLEKSNQELERFAYVASHDLKAPLRGIDNIVTWIIEDGESLDAGTKENLARIQKRINRMENLISGILEYSKINMEKGDHTLIDTSEILAETREQYDNEGENPIILDGEQATIMGSKTHFKQVVGNLVSNAIKYNDKEKPRVRIYCKLDEEHAVFTFEDNGPGIDKRYHGKIFELFQTLQPKDDVESTGVGLSIVKKIIEENGGKIWVESTLGQGTQFHFSWPAKHDRSHI